MSELDFFFVVFFSMNKKNSYVIFTCIYVNFLRIAFKQERERAREHSRTAKRNFILTKYITKLNYEATTNFNWVRAGFDYVRLCFDLNLIVRRTLHRTII